MKPRDRLVVCVLVAVAGLGAIWLGVVSPKRHEATQLGSKLTVAQDRLGAAKSQLAVAKAAETGYADNLRVVKSLYKAVPANDGVPHLLVSLDKSSHYKRVDFKLITVGAAATPGGAAASAPSPGAPSASAPSPGGAAAGAPVASGLSPIGFTFTFNGGYIDLQHFLGAVSRYTLLKGNQVVAHGRLLTIQSVALTPAQTSGGATSGPSGTQAAVSATAYTQLPAGAAAAPVPSTATVSTPVAPATTTR